jgi:Uma2 family endonuclease
MPTLLHQSIIMNLIATLYGAEKANSIVSIQAPLDILIRQEPLCTWQADILVMSKKRADDHGLLSMPGPVTVAPELVLEILERSQSAASTDGKLSDFNRIGVRECWIVRSKERTVEVLSLNEQGVSRVALYTRAELLRSLVFPDLSLSVERIFA